MSGTAKSNQVRSFRCRTPYCAANAGAVHGNATEPPRLSPRGSVGKPKRLETVQLVCRVVDNN